MDHYLQQLALKLKETLGNNLIGVYLIGSACLGAYQEGKSDLDVVGVLFNPLPDKQKEDLAEKLDHQHFPCPAKGLDLVLLTEDAVANITSAPPYEFWFATGASWRQEGWEAGKAKEMLIFIELCRRHGVILAGEDPRDFFAPIEKHLLADAFLEMLRWHQTKILDAFHDPEGQNSVLNACRVLAFLREGRLLSKSAGGEWLLAQEPGNETVKKALSIRSCRDHPDRRALLSEEEVASFLSKVIAAIG
ncbi:MAG: DUF4111 domain-containing protein [Phaeodactylibacter sp.]|nr:DUF4111 domain-containing protein [Phaeodactylibacter sp.]MCB9053995.1 DUF4111 domain-containing protein [Lewinellaceae bacterium]